MTPLLWLGIGLFVLGFIVAVYAGFNLGRIYEIWYSARERGGSDE